MSRFITTTVGRLHVGVQGSGPAMILWPSLFLDAAMYKAQVEAFQNSHTVVTVDGPGHGGSDAPPDGFTSSDCALACIEIMNNLQIAKTAFVGASWGGMVGLKLAAIWPGRVTSLVIAGTPIIMPSSLKRLANRSFALDFRLFGASAGTRRRIATTLFSPGFLNRCTDQVREATAGLLDADRVGMARAITSVLVKRRSLIATLPRVTCPVLVVAGEFDRIVPARQAEAYSRLLPHSRFVEIPGCGHLAALEDPDNFNHELRQFLATTGRAFTFQRQEQIYA